jgi:Tfp pilus assembly protein PilN
MQQINLYLPEFQPNREPLRSIHMLWGIVAFIGLLLVFSGMTFNANNERELALENNRQQLEQRKAQLSELEQQRPQSNLADLDGQIVQLQQDLGRREQILNIIANKKLGNNTGYSGHLQALGNQSLETISLQAFSLQHGGSYVEFAGQTSAADQVPLYIQQLRTQAVFAQSAFGVLQIKPNASGVFEFSLAKNNPRNVPVVAKTAVQQLLEANEKAATSTTGGQE